MVKPVLTKVAQKTVQWLAACYSQRYHLLPNRDKWLLFNDIGLFSFVKYGRIAYFCCTAFAPNI